jgi:hypothetical protein
MFRHVDRTDGVQVADGDEVFEFPMRALGWVPIGIIVGVPAGFPSWSQRAGGPGPAPWLEHRWIAPYYRWVFYTLALLLLYEIARGMRRGPLRLQASGLHLSGSRAGFLTWSEIESIDAIGAAGKGKKYTITMTTGGEHSLTTSLVGDPEGFHDILSVFAAGSVRLTGFEKPSLD